MNEINSIFETLGFKEEEVKTYLALLDTGASSGGNLAKKLGMPRPTVYGYLEKLITGGLVSRSMRNGVKIFVPEPGEKIRTLYKRKIEELHSKEKTLDTLLSHLDKRSGMSLMRPRILFYEGREGLETALQDPLSYKDSNMLSFWSVKAAIEATSEDFFWYINKQRIKNNLHLKAIWPPEQTVEVKRYPFMGTGPEFKREVRIAPKGLESSMGYWIYANKVLFASSRLESFCFIIESAELVQMMSNQHKAIWDISTPITPKASDMKPFLDDLYADR